MAGEWAAVPLSELTSTPPTYGVVQPGQDTASGSPMLRVNNFQGHSLNLSEVMRIAPEIEAKYGRTRIQTGDVLLTIVGSVGQVAVVPYELSGWNIARAIAMIRPNKPELSRWISLVLRAPQAQYQLGVTANTTVQTTINLKDLRELRIPLPDDGERDAIAHILGTLDDKIELNRRRNQTLEAMARALFKDWFVDFGPVRAKMEGRARQDGARSGQPRTPQASDLPWPGAEAGAGAQGEPYLPADLWQLFPDRLVESELGEIPEGWEIAKIEAVLKRLPAKVRYTKDQVSSYGKTPVFEQGASIILGFHDGDAFYQASADDPAFVFGDHTCITKLSCQPFDISQNVIPLRGQSRPTMWVYYAINEKQKFEEYRRHWMELITKSLIIAPNHICLEFAMRATAFHIQIEQNERESRTLAQIRDTLLPKLISGELRVAGAEECIERTGI